MEGFLGRKGFWALGFGVVRRAGKGRGLLGGLRRRMRGIGGGRDVWLG